MTRGASKFLRFAAPVIGYCALIFLASSQSDLPGMPVGGSDKIIHFIEYGILAWLFARALHGYGVPGARAAVLAVAACGLYGASDELHQRLTPNRFPEGADLLADVLGAAAAAAIWYRAQRTRRSDDGDSQLPGTSSEGRG